MPNRYRFYFEQVFDGDGGGEHVELSLEQEPSSQAEGRPESLAESRSESLRLAESLPV